MIASTGVAAMNVMMDALIWRFSSGLSAASMIDASASGLCNDLWFFTRY